MMSMNELYDQIRADQATIRESIGTGERDLPVMLPAVSMIPLEVLVRCTVLGQVATWIEEDFIWRTEYQPEGDAERERLEAAGLEASYDKRDVADFAEDVWELVEYLDNDCWALSGEFGDTTFERRGETREEIKSLAKAFLEELM